MKIKINQVAIKQVKKQLYNGLVDVSKGIGGVATQELTDYKWVWPRGESPRDIIDTGALRDSLSYYEMPNEYKVIIYYPLDYAVINHEGGINTNGLYFPPRPWLRNSLNRFSLYSFPCQL